MGYIKKLKNNELVGGTDKTTIYPVTSTEAVFEEVSENNFESQKYLNNHIYGGEGGRINQESITNYNIAKGTLSEDRLDTALKTKVQEGYDTSWKFKGEYDKWATYDAHDVVYDTATNSSYISLQADNQWHPVNPEDESYVEGWWQVIMDGKVSTDANNALVEYIENDLTQHVTGAISDANGAIQDMRSETLDAYTEAEQLAQQITDWSSSEISSTPSYTDQHPLSNRASSAQVGYFECGTSSTTQASNQIKAVTAGGYALPTSGGSVKIKMYAANTYTPTTNNPVKLQFNADATTLKELRYNGEAVSPSNTWDTGEVLSVYYDGTYYQASNAQGGSAIKKRILTFGSGFYDTTNAPSQGEAPSSRSSNTNFKSVKVSVSEGDLLVINGKSSSYSNSRFWATINSSNDFVNYSDFNAGGIDYNIVIPEGVAAIVINCDTRLYANPSGYLLKKGNTEYKAVTDSYIYGNLRTLSTGQAYVENEAVKTTAKQLLRMTKEIQPMSLTDTVEIGDLKVYDDGVNAATYKAQKSVEAYNGTETEGLYAIGSPSIITISVDASSLSIEEDTDISVTIGEDTQTITVPAAESETKAADIAALIASAFTSIDGWTLTDNEDGTLTLKCNTGGSNTISVSSNVGETRLVITSNAVNGTDKLCQYNSGAWGEVAIADYAEDAAEIGVSDGTKMWQKINIDEILYNHTTQDSINSSLENIEVYDYKETLIFDKTIESHPASQTGYALTVPVGFTVGNRYRIVAKMNKGLSKPLTTYLRQDPDESTPNIALSDMKIAASNVTGICFYEPSENSNYQYFNRWADTSTAMSINYKVYLLTPNTVKEEIGKLTEDIEYNQKEITDSISWGTIGIYGEVTINKAGNSGTACSLGGSGTWIHTQSSKHVVIPCTEGDIFDLTVLNNYNYYGWLASYSTPSVGDPVPYIAGESRHGRNTGSWHVVAPAGTAYLCLCTRDGAGNNTTWTGTAQIKKPLKEILDSAATTDNVEAIVQEEIDERVASYLYYPSSYIPINETYELFSNAYSSQGTALYGDCLASLHGNVSASNNKLRLFNLRTKTVIADNVFFPDFLNTRTHFNTMSFGVAKYDEGDDYPLLYVCSGYTYPEGSSITQVYAVRIVNTGGEYSTQLIQTINLDFGKASDWTEFVIDAGNGRAWIKSSGTGFTYICVALPSIDNSEVTINSSTTVIDSFNVKKPKHGLSNTNSQQGMYFYHGRIYQPWGIPDEQGEDSTYITIDNTLTHCREAVVSLKNYGLSDYEAESCFIWENDFYVVMHEGKIFKLIQN